MPATHMHVWVRINAATLPKSRSTVSRSTLRFSADAWAEPTFRDFCNTHVSALATAMNAVALATTYTCVLHTHTHTHARVFRRSQEAQ